MEHEPLPSIIYTVEVEAVTTVVTFPQESSKTNPYTNEQCENQSVIKLASETYHQENKIEYAIDDCDAILIRI